MWMVKNKFEVNGRPFEVPENDMVYPLVARAVMPTWSLGLFVAVLLGTVLSTFNSALQSASTLFGLEIYAIYIKPEADANSQKIVAIIFGVALSLFAYALAPQLAAFGSIFEYLQKLNAVCSLPIVSIFVIGLATQVPDAFAAKAGFAVGMLPYAGCQFLDGAEGAPHWLHTDAICFAGAILTMLAATYCRPLRKCFRQAPRPEPFVQSFITLREYGKRNALESLELVHPVVTQKKRDLIEKWQKEEKLECTQELGDVVKPLDSRLALSIYPRTSSGS